MIQNLVVTSPASTYKFSSIVISNLLHVGYKSEIKTDIKLTFTPTGSRS